MSDNIDASPFAKQPLKDKPSKVTDPDQTPENKPTDVTGPIVDQTWGDKPKWAHCTEDTVDAGPGDTG